MAMNRKQSVPYTSTHHNAPVHRHNNFAQREPDKLDFHWTRSAGHFPVTTITRRCAASPAEMSTTQKNNFENEGKLEKDQEGVRNETNDGLRSNQL